MKQSNYFHMTIVHPRPLDAIILNNPYFFIILLTGALVDAPPNSDGEDDSASSTEAKADPLQLVEEELKAADLGAQQPAEGFWVGQIGCHLIEETPSRLGTEPLADFLFWQISIWKYLKWYGSH